MRQETVHALIMAKTIFDSARQLISLANPHSCSAGLIFLQDALEVVFLSCLKELGVDQEKGLESLSFDQLIGELASRSIKVRKSGTLKALNKQRVIVKHYGQLADVVSTATYLEAAEFALNDTLRQVVGKGLPEIFLLDLLPAEHKIQPYLKCAIESISEGLYFEALLEIRKAYFLEIDFEYCIYPWRESLPSSPMAWFAFSQYGAKAENYKKNKEWISKYVVEPTLYVQVDAERLRVDAIEWGVSTSDIHNINSLTPVAVQLEVDGPWYTRVDSGFRLNMATLSNANYCLDRIIYLAIRKHEHQSARRWKQYGLPAPPTAVYLTHPVYERPDVSSRILHFVQEGFTYAVTSEVTGFDGSLKFLGTTVYPPGSGGQYSLGNPIPFFGFIVSNG